MKKKVTAKDVARAADVSQATVSSVFNNKNGIGISMRTRQKILEVARQLNYIPPRKNRDSVFAEGKTEVHIFMPTMEYPYFSAFLKHLQFFLHKLDLKCVLCITEGTYEMELAFLERINPLTTRGIVYTFAPKAGNALSEVAKRHSIPVSILARAEPGIYANVITSDNRHAGFLAMKRLVELGHKKIAYLSLLDGMLTYERKQRKLGLLDFSQKNKHDCGLVVFEPKAQEALASDTETGYALTCGLLDRHPDTTAIIGMNDLFAMGALNALNEKKIDVPAKISVMGFDNMEFSSTTVPKLTTFEHCKFERARCAFDFILNNDKEYRCDVVFKPVLIERDSIAPPLPRFIHTF